MFWLCLFFSFALCCCFVPLLVLRIELKAFTVTCVPRPLLIFLRGGLIKSLSCSLSSNLQSCFSPPEYRDYTRALPHSVCITSFQHHQVLPLFTCCALSVNYSSITWSRGCGIVSLLCGRAKIFVSYLHLIYFKKWNMESSTFTHSVTTGCHNMGDHRRICVCPCQELIVQMRFQEAF